MCQCAKIWISRCVTPAQVNRVIRRRQMSDCTSSFGEILRRFRIEAALSQEDLAERARLSTRGISDLERGVRRAPHLETVRLLADALALGPADRTKLLVAA